MKFPANKFGLKCDPRGAHVVMKWRGRELLGTVYGVYYDSALSSTRLKVRHFCGDEWPINPNVNAVDVLERTYEN
jgi:hypothetical protein